MDYPSNAGFPHFFFDTYSGYFLQVLPISLIAGVIYLIIERRKSANVPLGEKICRMLFVNYMTGLICLVLARDVIGSIWYKLVYHQNEGLVIRMFARNCNLIPDFFTHVNAEMIVNVFVFLPFGVLYPLSRAKATWKKTMLIGFVYIMSIEALQPFFGR